MPKQSASPKSERARHLLRPGLHVAPFLSGSGRLVILAIGCRHILFAAAEVSGLKGRRPLFEDAFKTGGRMGRGMPAWRLFNPDPTQGSMPPFLAPGNVGLGPRTLRRILLAPGVHMAPWNTMVEVSGGKYRAAQPVIAIDERHRFVAEMTAFPEDLDSARRDLLAFLNAPDDPDDESPNGPGGLYIDPYDDGYDDPDCCGEDWKR